jgi:ubiquinone/menaquinone biosynthesis C-methylase UbiE
MEGMAPGRRYFPAAGRDAFLPLYDPFTRLFGLQRVLTMLVNQAGLQRNHRVLDVGCGTGTLAVLVKHRHPEVAIVGLDPDPKALERARRKAIGAGVAARFERGFADALPHADGTFDRVFSSMMFHHLPKDDRTPTLVEIRRVLKPGGRLEFVDLAGGSHNMIAQLFHGGQVNAATDERLRRRMADAGFASATRVATQGTFVGALAFYQAATAPAEA